MRWLLSPVGGVIVAVSSAAVLADDKRDCLEGINHDLRIKGCSAVIGSNPNDAIAYFTRGLAYQFKGDVDRAISDYNSAIELNPYHASAYDGRFLQPLHPQDRTLPIPLPCHPASFMHGLSPQHSPARAVRSLAQTDDSRRRTIPSAAGGTA